jgi:hypothetical protein
LNAGEVASVRAAPEFLFVHGIAAPNNVPVDQPLLLTLELVSMSKGKESYSMNHAEKLEAASLKKEKANAVFKAGNFKCDSSLSRSVFIAHYQLRQAREGHVRSCREILFFRV